MVQLGEHFASDEGSRHSEWLRQRKWFIKARHEKQRKDDLTDKQEAATAALSAASAIATEVQIKAFKVKLDSYDTATVNALMENQLLLDAVNDRIEVMLANAYVMEDGRRVFRTGDGTQVFDEHGAEISQNELDPDVISPAAPTWEAFSQALKEEAALTAQRTEILEFQDRVDAARERVDNSDDPITEAELEALDAELTELMPEAAVRHMPKPVGTPELPRPTAERPENTASAATHSSAMPRAELGL